MLKSDASGYKWHLERQEKKMLIVANKKTLKYW